MADAAECVVNGVVYGGWDDVGVTRAMDGAAGAFNLSVADRWAVDEEPWGLYVGDAVEIRLGGESIISGYVDIAAPSITAQSHTFNVQGRDKSADMVDCSAIHSPDEWKNITVLELAGILGAPFGVSARADTDVGPSFPLVKLQQGETAMEALQRYAKTRRLLVMPDAGGGVLLTRTGTRRASVELVQGKNAKTLTGRMDGSQRFSDYIVKSQGNYSEDSADGAAEAHVQATARDAYVRRYRPLLIIADADALAASSAQDRAAWEANNRLGQSATCTIEVVGWRETPSGPLWAPNTLVKIRAPGLRLDGEMLIRQVTFRRGSGGTLTELDCVSPQAYDPAPPDGAQPRSLKKKDEKNPWIEALGIEGEDA